MMYEMPPFPSWSGASFESAETYYVNQKVQTPREARVQWLEREVESLEPYYMRSELQRGRQVIGACQCKREHESRPRTLEEMQREEEAGRRAKAMLTEENTEDALRSFPITLPKLASPSEKNAALLAGDWLTQIKPLISDVSTKAAGWWELVLRKTMEKYSLWLEAGPLERLRILPPEDDDFPKGYGGRLVQRVTTMLLAAVPEELRGELISTRQLTPQGILFRVLKAFQPGSLYERSQTLAALTGTAQAADPQEAVDALRLWRRQLLRAAELGASLPDPILLVNALDRVMGLLLQQQAQAAFRVSSYRMQHGIDVRPSKEAVQQFHELLLAEAEMMVGGVRQAEVEVPAVKVLAMTPATPPREGYVSGGVCKWWGSEGGCRMARSCRFHHPALEDKANRCWTCSARGHRKAECPYKGGQGQSPEATGGSEAGKGTPLREDTKGQGVGKGKKGQKGGSKGYGKNHGKAEDSEEGQGTYIDGIGNGSIRGCEERG